MKSLNLANDISKGQWIDRIDHDDIWKQKNCSYNFLLQN